MDDRIETPIIVVERGSSYFDLYAEEVDLEGALEHVDIEAGEYELVLDAAGRRLRVEPTGRTGVSVVLENAEPDDKLLRQTLTNHLAWLASNDKAMKRLDMDFTTEDVEGMSARELLALAEDIKLRPRPGLRQHLRSLLRR
ncbi:MAG: hypothetical protein KDC46_08220 [Thermoleophilia bacterium]|nr:hypothetical protein [Thermoleophilia bacterium]